jgi:glycosyltransferase involved in cell wall biosynthesis
MGRLANEVRGHGYRMTTVGVVIASYNPQRDHLSRAVDSVRSQTYTHWDCVVVDDGSASPISIAGASVIRQNNRGVAAARNRGVAAVSGEYIAFLDQDDCWHPEKLARQVPFMREHGLAMCDTDFNIVRDGEILATGYDYHRGDFLRLLSTARIGLSTLVVRRDAFDHVGGFNPLFQLTSDWEFELRLAHAGYEFDRFREVLCTYYLHDRNASSDYRTAYHEQIALLDLYATLDTQPPLRKALVTGRKRLRELYAYQAIDAFRSSRRIAHLAWATQRAPRVMTRAVFTKVASRRGGGG